MSVGYDEALFVLGGDPDAIAASASRWNAFAAQASVAADALRGLDTDDFAGDEADRFRQVLDADLDHRLRTSSAAWGIVGAALGRFGGALDECQQRIRPLRVRASDAWQSACRARTDAATQLAAQQAQLAAYRPTGGESQPLPQPEPGSCTAGARLGHAADDLNALMDEARSIRARHDDARDACTAEIHRAAGMRFAEPPGWFAGLISSIGGWIADRAAALSGISAILKQISSISGMLAMIPVLAPVMAPISMATGAIALAVDGTVMAATGKGSWSDLVMEGASMLPGAKAAMAVGTVQTAVAADDAATGDGSWADVFTIAASVAVGAKGAHGRPSRRSGPERKPAQARPEAEPRPGAEPIVRAEPVPAAHDSQVDTTATPGGGAAPPSSTATGYGDEVLPTMDAAPAHKRGEPDDPPNSSEPTDASGFPANLPHGTEHIYFAANDRVPPSWIPHANRDGKGIRWWGARPDTDRVRIDLANPNSPFPSQRVDHVIVHSNGKVIGPDGFPIARAIGEDWQCHIPLIDWLQWQTWNAP